MLKPFGIELDRAPGGGSGDERAGRALRMKAAEEKALRRGAADAMPDFVACRHCGNDVAPVYSALLFGIAECDRSRDRACVNNRFLVDIVELERVPGSAIHQGSQRYRALLAYAHERSDGPRTFCLREVGNFERPRQRGAKQTAADRVEY